MKILVQKNDDKDCIGLVNALPEHEIVLWSPTEEVVKADLYIFTEPEKLGYETAKTATKTLFFKCVQPAIFKKPCISVETIPLCADMARYPLTIPNKKVACDVFYLSNFPLDDNKINLLSQIQGQFTFRIAGNIPVNLPNYIGRLDSPQEVSEYCLSAGLCIDFDFNYAPDILKIGGRVITSKENTLDIPTFSDNINEVIADTLAKKKPVLNKYEVSIISYKALATNLFQMLGL